MESRKKLRGSIIFLSFFCIIPKKMFTFATTINLII